MYVWRYASDCMVGDSTHPPEDSEFAKGPSHICPPKRIPPEILFKMQPAGFVDNFPSKFYEKPKRVKSSSDISNFVITSKMGRLGRNQRLADLINQCRYIAQKKGMSKRELMKSIKNDELVERQYRFLALSGLHPGGFDDVASFISPNGMNFSGDYWHLSKAKDFETTLQESDGYRLETDCFANPPDSMDQSNIIYNTNTPDQTLSECDLKPLVNSHCIRKHYCKKFRSESQICDTYIDDESDHLFADESELDIELMEAAQLINKLGLDQYCNSERCGKSFEKQIPSVARIPAVRTYGIHNLSLLNENEQNGNTEDCDVNGKPRFTQGFLNPQNEPIPAALKNYSAYSDDSDGHSLSDYSTTEEEKPKAKKAVSVCTQETQAGFRLEPTRNLQILKKSESSFFGSRDEYGKLVGTHF